MVYSTDTSSWDVMVLFVKKGEGRSVEDVYWFMKTGYINTKEDNFKSTKEGIPELFSEPGMVIMRTFYVN